MITLEGRSREVALPSGSFGALRAALTEEAGPLAAIHVLHSAGYDVGHSLYASFAGWAGTPPAEMGETEFWSRLSSFLQQRGWGTLRHESPHPGIGLLTSSDWAEAEEDGDGQPACSFSSGMLSGLLTEAAGGPVAVLQVGCRAAGDEACAFAFGSEATVHDLYGILLEGADFDGALAQL